MPELTAYDYLLERDHKHNSYYRNHEQSPVGTVGVEMAHQQQ